MIDFKLTFRLVKESMSFIFFPHPIVKGCKQLKL